MWDRVGVSQCQYVVEKLEGEEAVDKQPVSQTLQLYFYSKETNNVVTSGI